MSHARKPRNSPSLILLLATLLTACSQPPPSPECPVSVHASPEVKEWLRQADLPPEVLHWLKLIGDEQAAIDEECGR